MKLKASITTGTDAFNLPERHIFIQVGSWELFIAVAVKVSLDRWRTLPNGDRMLWSEPLPPPDAWCMQPTRRDGTPW